MAEKGRHASDDELVLALAAEAAERASPPASERSTVDDIDIGRTDAKGVDARPWKNRFSMTRDLFTFRFCLPA